MLLSKLIKNYFWSFNIVQEDSSSDFSPKEKGLTKISIHFYSQSSILCSPGPNRNPIPAQSKHYLSRVFIPLFSLKPENVLIGVDGYIKITDFGLSKNNILGDYDTFSVCGTPEYLAPEVIKKQGHGKPVDWWCFGSLIYELVHGLPPFYSKNRSQLFEKIKNGQPYLNKNWSPELRDLFRKLFEKVPEERMKNVQAIKQHPWFSCINWQYLAEKKIKPPFVPFLHGQSDVSNFSKQFTACSIESNTSSFTECKNFQGFSYEHSKNSNSPQEEEKMEVEQDEIEFTMVEKSKNQ